MKQHRVVERHHPIFSPIALAATVFLILGLAAALWLTGGRAFSPGHLSAVQASSLSLNGFDSHAAFEDDCTQCHAPFAGIDPARCEACHTNIAAQRESGQGLHGGFEGAARCAACHEEHRGRAFDLTRTAAAQFDHAATGFALARHDLDFADRPLSCVACHTDSSDLSDTAGPCVDCHMAEDETNMRRHVAAFGMDCLLCHDGVDTLASFTVADHADVFPLVGAHQAAACETCHEGGFFAGTPQDCFACHEEPVLHAGILGTDCAGCHDSVAWRPAGLPVAIFDHEARFSLILHEVDYEAAPMGCVDCHVGESFAAGTFACADCHGAEAPAWLAGHVDRFGSDCLTCHDGVDRMADFDHAAVFTLTGQHQSAACEACHIERQFAGTPRECVACHAEPEIHLGLFGQNCAACHNTAAWQPAELSQHSFPLDHGGEGLIPCATCHTATFTGYTCDACHPPAEMIEEHGEEGIGPVELVACVSCHPTGTEDEAEGGD